MYIEFYKARKRRKFFRALTIYELGETMKSTTQKQSRASQITGLQRSYQEITAYLDAHWHTPLKESMPTIVTFLESDLAIQPKQQKTIIISGSNGKSITAHFTTRLLQSEGLSVGTLLTPHTKAYTERISYNDEQISLQEFTDLGNTVLNAANTRNIALPSSLVLDAIALLFFTKKQSDVLVIEANTNLVAQYGELYKTNVLVVTRITSENTEQSEEKQLAIIAKIRSLIQSGTHVISGDQLKQHLQALETITNEQNGIWEMPIRKLAPLGYPFEQIHGRCAALAERASSIYMNSWGTEEATIVNESLLVKQKGKRGRPTLEAKQQAKLHPKKTIDQFWKDTLNELPSRFELREEESPAVILDNADNLDALENLLLGARLLHYKRPVKSLTLIMSAEAQNFETESFVRAVRYFFKKTPGQIFICPLDQNNTPWTSPQGWDTSALAAEFTNKKVKASAFTSFAKAFEAAKDVSNPEDGLIVVTGSASIITSYLKYRGSAK